MDLVLEIDGNKRRSNNKVDHVSKLPKKILEGRKVISLVTSLHMFSLIN